MKLQIPQLLLMHTPINIDIKVGLMEVKLQEANDEVTECCLTILVDRLTYELIDREELFNLSREVRGPMFGDSFRAEAEIEIVIRLDEMWLSLITLFAPTEEKFLAYLLERAEVEPNNLLLGTEAWFGLYVRQEMDLPPALAALGSVKTGYSTKWAKRKAE